MALRLGATLLVVAAGCWGGGSGRVSSLERTQVIGALDERAFRGLCRDVDRWAEGQFGSAEFKRWHCEIDAALTIRHTRTGVAQSFEGECRVQARACAERAAAASVLQLRCERGPGACPLTVDHLERCLTDLAYNLYGLFLTTPMCDDICRPFDPSTLDAPSCRAFRAACPGYAFTGRPSFPLLESGVPDNCLPVPPP